MANCKHTLNRQCTSCDSQFCVMCNQGPACPECGKMGGFKITLGSVASGSLISQTNQERTSGAVIYRT